jgi:hypothetical protein
VRASKGRDRFSMKKPAEHLLTSVALAIAIITFCAAIGESKTTKISQNFPTDTDTIDGQSGGGVDSKGCGFIGSSPNYVLNVDKRLDYMRITVRTSGGQPTLLVKGPGADDSFCILADRVSGFQPEISGVWEPGEYKIYVGDRNGGQFPFKLNISKK